MPRIFDNIELKFIDHLRDCIKVSTSGDFCVGYFYLRGWRLIEDLIDNWKGLEGQQCRLIVGMQSALESDLKKYIYNQNLEIDQNIVLRLQQSAAQEFRNQIAKEVPTNADELGLRKLAKHLRQKKLVVRIFLRHQLHAKLYMLHRSDVSNPTMSFVGSSNLSFSGLSKQGELNVDVLDHDACLKLKSWFEDRWDDSWCLDISDELANIIEESWAKDEIIPPYHIYLKMAYHLSREARIGIDEYRLPEEFRNTLFDFQSAAVKIASQHLNKRGGVLLGDVVGLGKTLMATAIARMFQDEQGSEVLIICPKNLISMWEDYVFKYRLFAKVLPISLVMGELSNLRRYRLVVIDESHNLRNREGKRFKIIQEYIQKNESKCILLSATPYNKDYSDLSSQLRLFLSDEQDLGIRPEAKINELGETEFIRRFQCPARTLSAFDKSEFPDDWRELMRLFMVRRTRSFIKEHYAKTEQKTGKKYLQFMDGSKSFFPERIPKTIKFEVDTKSKKNQYAVLYSEQSLTSIMNLKLPRYGLGNYVKDLSSVNVTPSDKKVLAGLSRAGKRLTGICRTSLFKRLESGGPAFIKSLQRHILRNYLFIYALKNNLPLPIGTQSIELFDLNDREEPFENSFDSLLTTSSLNADIGSVIFLLERASEVYQLYRERYLHNFKWIQTTYFKSELVRDLENDSIELQSVLEACGEWLPNSDKKLLALEKLLKVTHPREKVLIFSQFADTVNYLHENLKTLGIGEIESVTGDSDDPAVNAWRFSPVSNEKEELAERLGHLRVLVTTDVLSEGFNLQDSAIIVNYDLPWAIIRLVQRAGRVDRIGQKAERIICYSFMPAERIEDILNLRMRVRSRLRQNAEVIGTDESFFEDEKHDQPIIDLYNERSGILDASDDEDIDLSSYALQIWKDAIDSDPELEKIIPDLAPVSYSAKHHKAIESAPDGVLVYLEANGIDALAWIDKNGKSVSQSQKKILEMAKCSPNTPGAEKSNDHHALVAKALSHITANMFSTTGQLGRSAGPRHRAYDLLNRYRLSLLEQPDLFTSRDFLVTLDETIEEIYKYPLTENANAVLAKELKQGISASELAKLVMAMKNDNRLNLKNNTTTDFEPKIICSLGLTRGDA